MITFKFTTYQIFILNKTCSLKILINSLFIRINELNIKIKSKIINNGIFKDLKFKLLNIKNIIINNETKKETIWRDSVSIPVKKK